MIQDITGEVVEVKDLTHDVKLISLKVPETFTFQAGQFVSIRIEKGEEFKMRSYSILNEPGKKGFVDLCIKIVPDGYASSTFAQTKVGDTFQLKGPMGRFTFDLESKNKENWFIATGTGITPFYSMIKEYVAKVDAKFVLLFGVRNENDAFFVEEFENLAQEHDNFEFIHTLSQGEVNGRTGRVQKYLPEDLSGKTFYICGLKDLVLETTELLASKGVDLEDIHKERYT